MRILRARILIYKTVSKNADIYGINIRLRFGLTDIHQSYTTHRARSRSTCATLQYSVCCKGTLM